MKKIVVLLAVIALTAPVYADDVDLILKTTLVGSDYWIEVSYDASTASQPIRGLAFDMDLDSGATFEEITNYKQNVFSIAGDEGLGVYLDSIDFGTDPNTIDDPGSPITDPLELGTSHVTVCMASLYDPCDPVNAPGPTGHLFDIRVSKTYTALTITGEPIRGGCVMEDGGAGTLDYANLTDPADKYMVIWGLGGQCHGDSGGDLLVDTADFSIFRVAWGTGLGNPDYHPGADLTRDGLVDTADFAEFRVQWGLTVANDCTYGMYNETWY